MVHQWAGLDVTEADVAKSSFTPLARGTYQSDMLGAARRRGQLAVEIHGFDAILGEVAAGHPVIVFQNLGLGAFPIWHYAVVVAYDLDRKLIVLHSGENDRMTMPILQFMNTWDRAGGWAITVLPPNMLPATAREWDVLEAAAALERAGQLSAAEIAYRSGARRWPESWIWPFGLGNALYAQGRLREARGAYAEAVRRDPAKPEPQRNLREVEIELASL